jgi:hypothetical protein
MDRHHPGVLTAICRRGRDGHLWWYRNNPAFLLDEPLIDVGEIRSVAPLCPACRAALAAGHHE